MPDAAYPFQQPCFIKQRRARTQWYRTFSPALQLAHTVNENINYIPQKYLKNCVYVCERETNSHASSVLEALVLGKHIGTLLKYLREVYSKTLPFSN